MTAEEILNEKKFYAIQKDVNPTVWKYIEFVAIVAIKEYAKLKCAEQRINCNIEAKVGHGYGDKQYETNEVFDIGEHTFYVDVASIINAKEPEI